MATLPNLQKGITKDTNPPSEDTQISPVPVPNGTVLLTTKLHNEIVDNLDGIIDYVSGDVEDTKIPQSAIADLITDLLGKEDNLSYTPEDTANKGIAGGYASLDANVMIPNTQIPVLDADKITSGIFGIDRIPDLAASKITSGTFGINQIPELAADKINSGIFDNAQIPNLTIGKIPDSLITLPKLALTGIKDDTTFLRGDGVFVEIPAGDIGANVELSNLGTTAITEHLNFGLNVGFQTQLFQMLQQNNSLFLQTKNENNRLIVSSTGFQFDPAVGVIFSNKRVGEIRTPLANDEAANKSYVDSEINDLDTGANKTLSNLDDPMALNQDITFSKVSPSIYLRAIDGGIHFNSYNILESATDLRIFENTNNEHGIIINPQLLQFVSSNDIDINNNKLLNVSTPTLDTDGATKKYVDDNSGSGGANIELSNLDPNTLINQDLTFVTSGKGLIFPNGASVTYDAFGELNLKGRSGTGATQSEIRFGQRKVTIVSSDGLDMNNKPIFDLSNPNNSQDAVTLNYLQNYDLALSRIPDNLITLAKLNTSGVKNNTTFLRGDGTFAVPQSGGIAGANTELSNLGVTAINTHLNLTGTNRLNFANAGSIRPENNTNALGIYAGNTLTSLFDDNGIISYVPINMGANKITALGTPTQNDDAATKLYVDENSGGTVNFDELEGTLDNTQIPELEINLSKLNGVGSDGGLMFVSSDGAISQIGNNATINQILVWAGGGWQPRDQPVIPTPIIYANRNLSNLTDPVSFNQHLIFSVTDGEITFANGSQVSSSANPRIFGPGIQILSPSGLNGLIITDTAIGFELLSENRKEIHFGNLKLMNALDPTADQDVATKHYVDNHAGIGGATTALSNLTTTAIDQELIFVDGSKGITFALGGKLNHTTGGVRIRGGDEGILTSIMTLAPTEITLFSVLGLNMSDKKITNLLTPSNDKDAATKKYVDDIDGGANATLSNLGTTALNAHLNFAIPQGQINFMDGSSIRGNTLGILIQGSQDDNHSFIFLNDLEFNFHSATDEFNFNRAKLTNLLTPTNDQDAATKKYVDDNSGGGGTINFNEIEGTISTAQYGNNTISTEKLQNLSITGAKIAVKSININKLSVSSGESLDKGIVYYNLGDTDFTLGGLQDVTGSLELSQIDATGSRNANTFLRGDGTWSPTPSGGTTNFNELIGTLALNQIPNALITLDKISASGVRDNTTFLRGDGTFVNIPAGTGGANQELSNLDANTLINQDLNFAKENAKIIFENGAEIVDSVTGIRLDSASKLSGITISNAGINFRSSVPNGVGFGNVRLHSIRDPSDAQDAVTRNYLENYDLAITQIPDNLITANKINQSGATDGQVLRWSDASSAFTPQDP